MTWLMLVVLSSIAGGVSGAIGSEAEILLTFLIVLIGLWPCLAIGAQRFHDFGASGWWNLLSLVPFVGFIVFLILLFALGDKQANRFGPVPTIGNAPMVLAPE
jgi:uncharacterized membrane protein YhaH (DUF805 family)